MVVTIIVVSYNSSKYILKCLDSIYNQCYKDIELIITDDSSKDDTINIVEDWLASHSQRFVNSKVVVARANTGVTANCNRGIIEANGDWIKMIAADDYLSHSDSISCYTRYIQSSNAQIICGNINRDIDGVITKQTCVHESILKKYRYNSKIQRNFFVLGNFVWAASVIFNRDAMLKLGCYDETIPMLEDAPMWLKFTEAGYPIYFIEEALVTYRDHNDSIVGSYKNSVNVRYLRSHLLFMEKYRLKRTHGLLKQFLKLSIYGLRKWLYLYDKKEKTSANMYLTIYRYSRIPAKLYVRSYSFLLKCIGY